MYTLSSYLEHSCTPSARPSFEAGTTELHVIANRDLKAGEEVTVSWVDVTQGPGESVVECRRRRRVELVRGWKFACGCARCEEEGKEVAAGGQGEGENAGDEGVEQKDESKVEDSLRRYEEKEGGGSGVDVDDSGSIDGSDSFEEAGMMDPEIVAPLVD